MYEDIGATTIVGEELYHYGRKGMKWYQHIYGPMQSIAKYAKKVGSKLSDAKASHDEKQKVKDEQKKEEIIRSGDAKLIRKNQDKLSDAELKRAFDRLKNTPNDSDQKQKQGQDFADKKGSVKAKDLINAFSEFANDVDKAYKAVDKLVGVKNDIKKYTKEEREKTAKINDIMSNLKIKEALDNPALLSDKQWKDLNDRHNNFTKLKERYEKENAPAKQNINTPLAAYLKTQESSSKPTSYKSYKEYDRISNMISSMNVNQGKGKGKGQGNISKDDLRNIVSEVFDDKMSEMNN